MRRGDHLDAGATQLAQRGRDIVDGEAEVRRAGTRVVTVTGSAAGAVLDQFKSRSAVAAMEHHDHEFRAGDAGAGSDVRAGSSVSRVSDISEGPVESS